jgi:hypothetical protein
MRGESDSSDSELSSSPPSSTEEYPLKRARHGSVTDDTQGQRRKPHQPDPQSPSDDDSDHSTNAATKQLMADARQEVKTIKSCVESTLSK